jgi:diacylglycerol kinase family enzyme
VGCISKYTGNGMLLAPQASIDDGMIDVVVVRQASRRELLQLFRKVFDGSHVDLPFVECHQVRRFAIERDDQRPLNLDGESWGQAPFTVEMVQGALRIFA